MRENQEYTNNFKEKKFSTKKRILLVGLEDNGFVVNTLKKKAGENRNFTNVSNQIEKRINQLAKIGANVLTFARTPQNSSSQSRMLKAINASVKQLQRQIAQIQKAVEG